ncbi:MAG: ATP-binding protein [Azonexus sp.]|nr:ATP-binding protein [Azonexus sp.]MDP3637376.1 ATP-binding protein [Azonexus sp.]MDZ4316710.1 ATP-binding protein [Azonexus sp.]
MPFISCNIDNPEHLTNLRRLVSSRWGVLAAMAALVITAPLALDISLPQTPLLGILGVTALFNLIVQWRLRQASSVTAYELFSQLLFDIVVLGALLFFSGGATNPLVSLLLPAVAIAALTLPAPCVFAVVGGAVFTYSLLMIYYIPLPMPDASRATRLHLIGMWLTFAISAAMIAWFVVRMTRLIRERDAALAGAREQALRDERVMAMGTLAAGAAHELGTPLATIALLAGELAKEPTMSQAAQEDIALLRQQIGICKTIITGLSRRAEAERLENTSMQAADTWLESVRQHWHASRPKAGSRLVIGSDHPAPTLVTDPRLEQAVLNLLNNAANATTMPLEIRLSWCSQNICIDIRDFGPGFPPSVLQLGGQHSFPAHELGSGVGLMLTQTAIAQLGGQLTLSNPEDGGALARIELPQTAQ